MKSKFLFLLKQNIFVCLDYGQSKNQFEYFRIVIPVFSLFNFALFLLDYKTFLLPDGIIDWQVTDANAFWFEPHLFKLSNYFHTNSLLVLTISSILYGTSLVLLALGIFTRLCAFIAFSLFLLFSVQLYPFLYGVDLYQSVFLFMLCIFPSGYSVSLARKSAGARIINQQKIGVRGIQGYLILTYLSAGLGKAKMDTWLNGKFLFLSLSDPNYQLFHFSKDLPYTLYVFLGISVVIAELGYFVFILIPHVRSVLVCTIVIMHLFIGIFMGLIPFAVLLTLVNIVCWYPLIVADFKNVLKPRKKYELAL